MRIYLDIDGVLADCQRAALAYYGVHPEEYPKGMRVRDILAGMQITVPSKHGDFWSSLGEDFWPFIPVTDICFDLFYLATELVGKENVFIASRPTGNPDSYSGKAIWVQENLPWGNLILIEDKSLLARPGDTLVDDHPVNCDKFCEAGGKAVFIKRPWNGHDDMPWSEISASLKLCALDKLE